MIVASNINFFFLLFLFLETEIFSLVEYWYELTSIINFFFLFSSFLYRNENFLIIQKTGMTFKLELMIKNYILYVVTVVATDVVGYLIPPCNIKVFYSSGVSYTFLIGLSFVTTGTSDIKVYSVYSSVYILQFRFLVLHVHSDFNTYVKSIL